MTPTAELMVSGIRQSVALTAIIDTGFEGEVCVPLDVGATLGLELVGSVRIELADGSQKRDLLFAGSAEFLGASRGVLISLTDGEDALIGTELLSDCHLSINFVSGKVRVNRKHPGPRRGKGK